MAWHLIYGGTAIMKYDRLADVEAHQAEIQDVLRNGGGWYALQHPRGDGIGNHKLLLTSGVPILFREID